MSAVTIDDILTVYVADFQASLQPQPFPMQGSKRAQVPVINRLVPPNVDKLFEPFCGSAAASIGMRFEGLVDQVVISDTNPSLIDLWRDILERPSELADEYTDIWNRQFKDPAPDPRGYFNLVRDRHNQSLESGSADFLFLLNRIVKAALRYGKNGKMNQSADPRRLGAKPSTVRERLTGTSAVLNGTQAFLGDWMGALADASVNDLIYLDPPYQGTSDTRDQRYIAGMGVETFEDGLASAVGRGLSLIVSYDALVGPVVYGRPLDPGLGMLALDVVTGVSAQGTLLGRKQEAHETIYLSPALVDRLGGREQVGARVAAGHSAQEPLPLAV